MSKKECYIKELLNPLKFQLISQGMYVRII